MRQVLSAAAMLAVLAAAPVLAQTTPPATTTAPPAVASPTAPSTAKADAPVPGANSFTEAQARGRIESNGFSNVSGLKKDEQSIWRGQAMKDGKTVSVAVDYQGNVVAVTN
jgi:putative membrane protein